MGGRRISLSLVIHNHQPVGNFGWVFEDVYRQAYEPMIGALERHPKVHLGLHYTGPLLEWLRQTHPDALARVRNLVARGQVEIVGGAYFEPVLISLPERDRHGQLIRMREGLGKLFGQTPRGAWLAERVWEPSLPHDLARAGYEWTVLDDNHLRGASVKEDQMWGAYTTDDQGEMLTVFGTEQGLRYRIPFGEVDDLIRYLWDHATESGERLGTMGDDGEKFGAWPGTFEHCWGRGRWIDRCFSAIEDNAEWLSTVTPSGWLDREPPVGRIYVPTASYVEMTQWALPADEANVFGDLLHAARDHDLPEARFLRGGMWRNFQARYREVNDLHKQMLRVSAKVARMPEGADREAALDHLYRGQSNDCYWHGLFGGIYIVHMRMATLANLIGAEDIADRALGEERGAWVEDVDLDGIDEVRIATPGQQVVVDLAEGAGIGSWDLRASRVALASVIRRRPEAYHATLLEHERRVAAEAAGDGGTGSGARAGSGVGAGSAAASASGDDGKPKTIHDIVTVKEPGLADRLHYDRFERRSGLIHVLPATLAGGRSDTTSPDAFIASRYEDLGDFADRPFELVSVEPGRLVVRRDGSVGAPGLDGSVASRPLAVARVIELGDGRFDPWLQQRVELANTGPDRLEFELAVEWNLDLMGGGANPAAYYEVTADGVATRTPHDGSGDVGSGSRLSMGNIDVGVRVDVLTTPAARATWYPVETISNSEAGFERVYQGSCLLLRWPLALAPGETVSVTARFDVTESTDATSPDGSRREAGELGAEEASGLSAR